MQVNSVTPQPMSDLEQKGMEQKLKKVCDEFSSLFVSMLWKEMRNTVPDDGLIKKSMAEKIFQEMADNKVAEEMSHNEGFALSRVLYEQLKIGIIPAEKKNK